jgi:hypothetical protein
VAKLNYLVGVFKPHTVQAGSYVMFYSHRISGSNTLGGDLKSEIEGGAVLAAIRAHRQIRILVTDDESPPNTVHNLLLLRPRDADLDVSVELLRSDKRVASVLLHKCQLMSFTAIQEGYVAFFRINGGYELEIDDESE